MNVTYRHVITSPHVRIQLEATNVGAMKVLNKMATFALTLTNVSIILAREKDLNVRILRAALLAVVQKDTEDMDSIVLTSMNASSPNVRQTPGVQIPMVRLCVRARRDIRVMASSAQMSTNAHPVKTNAIKMLFAKIKKVLIPVSVKLATAAMEEYVKTLTNVIFLVHARKTPNVRISLDRTTAHAKTAFWVMGSNNVKMSTNVFSEPIHAAETRPVQIQRGLIRVFASQVLLATVKCAKMSTNV